MVNFGTINHTSLVIVREYIKNIIQSSLEAFRESADTSGLFSLT